MTDALICARTARGTKHRCPSCEQPFYDLGRAPVECPYCGQSFETSAAARHNGVVGSAERSRVDWKNSAAPLSAVEKRKQSNNNE